MKNYLYLLLSLLLFCACDDEKSKFEPDGLTAFCKCYTENVYVVRNDTLIKAEDALKQMPGFTQTKYIYFNKGHRIKMNPKSDFIKNDTIYRNDTIFNRSRAEILPLRLAIPAKYFDFQHRVEMRDFDHFGRVFYHHVAKAGRMIGFDVFAHLFEAESVGNNQARNYMWISFAILAVCLCIWLYVLFSDSCPALLFWGWTALYCASGYYQWRYFIGYDGSLLSDTFCETLFCTPFLLYIIVHIVMTTSLIGNFNNRYAAERSVHFSLGIAGMLLYIFLFVASKLFNDFFGWGVVNVAVGLGCWLGIDALYASFKNHSLILPFASVFFAMFMVVTISGVMWIAISNVLAFFSFTMLGFLLHAALGGYVSSTVNITCGQCRMWSSSNGSDHGYCKSKKAPRNRYTKMCHSVREHVINDAQRRDMLNYADHKNDPRPGDKLASTAGKLCDLIIYAIIRVQSAC